MKHRFTGLSAGQPSYVSHGAGVDAAVVPPQPLCSDQYCAAYSPPSMSGSTPGGGSEDAWR